MKDGGWKQTAIGTIMGILFLFGAALPGIASADDDVKLLKQRLEQMSKEMESVQKKLEDLEKKNEAKEEAIEEMDDRLNKAELHTATDKVSFGVELRTRADVSQDISSDLVVLGNANAIIQTLKPGVIA